GAAHRRRRPPAAAGAGGGGAGRRGPAHAVGADPGAAPGRRAAPRPLDQGVRRRRPAVVTRGSDGRMTSLPCQDATESGWVNDDTILGPPPTRSANGRQELMDP